MSKHHLYMCLSIISLVFLVGCSDDGDRINIFKPYLFEGTTVDDIERNVAYGKAYTITTNGFEDTTEIKGTGYVLTDSNLETMYGWKNNDSYQPMTVTITIYLQRNCEITKIRYNQGNCRRANTWNADTMETPFEKTSTKSGTSNKGDWTEHTGNIVSSTITIKFEKTKTTQYKDWLFIGEIDIIGK